MLRISVLLLVCVAFRAIASPPPLTLRQQFEEIIRQEDASLAGKNISGDVRRNTADFRGVDIAGHVYGNKVSASSGKKTFSVSQSVEPHTELVSVVMQNGTALVVTHEHTTLKIVGQKTGRLHTLVFDGLWRSEWVKQQGRWLNRRSKQLTQTITHDGVPRVVLPKNANINP